MTRGHLLRIALLCLLLAGVIATAPFLVQGRYALTIALAIALAMVCLIPTFYDRWRKRFDLFEIIHPVAYLCIAYFALSPLYILYEPRAAYDSRVMPYLNTSIVLCIVGICSMFYGYYLVKNLKISLNKPRMMEVRGVVWIALVFAVGYIGQLSAVNLQMQYSGRVSGVFSLFQQLESLALFCYFLLAYLWFSGRATPPQRLLLLAGVLPAELLMLYMRLSSKAFSLWILGLPIVAFWYARRRLPRLSLVTLALFTVFIIFPFSATFRIMSRDLPISERVSATVTRLTNLTPATHTQESTFLVGRRMALISSVAVVVRETGRSVDYQYGRTIGLTAVSLAIPRFLWPDKPTIPIGREFARQFKILPRWNVRTWVSVTPIGEWYWNFGVPGVLGGMFLQGVFWSLIYTFLGSQGGRNPVRLAVYAALLPVMLMFETNVASWLGTTLKMLVVYGFLYWVLRSTGLLISAGRTEERATAKPHLTIEPATSH